jgi:hypothetical protein
MRAYNHRIDNLTEEDMLTLCGQVLKACTKCHRVLLSEEFYKSNKSTSGVISQCKDCTNKRTSAYFNTDKGKEVCKNIGAKARQTEGYKQSVKKYMQSDKYRKRMQSDKHKEDCRRYQLSEKGKANHKRVATPEKIQSWGKKYRQSIKYKERLQSIEYKNNCRKWREKRLGIPGEKLRDSLHSSIGYALRDRKRGRSWEGIVGYNLDSLVSHIEKQFVDGMSWDNYGQGKGKWHIDHIIPQSIFGYIDSNDLDFKRCWALSNLRPMWGLENISKSGKIIKPFQPSLDVLLYKGEIKNKVDMTVKDLHSVYKCDIVS